MHKQFYFLSPVEVVKVTSQNLAEVAEWCGGKVAQAESRRVPGRMDSYVWVPTPKGSNISWAFPGMFITKRLVVTVKGELKATWSVFRRDYFEKNYFDTPNDAVDKTWELEDRTPKAKQEATPGEPVIEPPASTLDAENMTDEEREHIEQVNMSKAVKLVEEELGGVVIESPDPLKKSQPVASEVHEAVLETNSPSVHNPIPEPATEAIDAYVHDHLYLESCAINPDLEGVHVYNDQTVNVTADAVIPMETPAAIAEKKA